MMLHVLKKFVFCINELIKHMHWCHFPSSRLCNLHDLFGQSEYFWRLLLIGMSGLESELAETQQYVPGDVTLGINFSGDF